MKRFFITALVLGLINASATTVSAVAGDPVPLRYQFKADETNIYKVEIEAQGESGKEGITANMSVSARPAGDGLTTLVVRGGFRIKPGPISISMGPRFGNPQSLSSYTMMMPSEARELTIDAQGLIVRSAADLSLPIPLGQLLASLIQTYPANPANAWESEEKVFILDEPAFQGPAAAFLSSSRYEPMMPGRGPQAVLAALQKTSIRVADMTNDSVVLKKSINLTSAMKQGPEPRVSATGEGEIVFNHKTGKPMSVEMKCKLVAVTETVSRRSEYTLRWKLLEGSEREAALAPAPVSTPKELTPEQTTKLLSETKSENVNARRKALQELGEVAKPSPEIIEVMAAFAKDEDDSLRRTALTILAKHGGNEYVPLLIRGLNESDSMLLGSVLRGLARLKDPRAAEPLGELVATGHGDPFLRMTRSDAAETLGNFGPAAEPVALSLLKEKHLGTRILACNILKKVGTKKSLTALKAATVSSNKELSEAAAEASRTVQARQ